MRLLDNLWTSFKAFCVLIIHTPLQDGSQAPLMNPSPSRIAPPSLPAPIVHGGHGPGFYPPGIPRDSEFKCHYPKMVGWEFCSTPYNRQCWLREKSTGKEFNIRSDYENTMPIGITRRYNITLEDSWFAADGLNFTAAKLFREDGATDNTYPGPWIEACWGDTIIVNVTNKLTRSKNGTSVHWHGIRQNQTMHMDGVNGVTQCPIAPNDYFVYNFTATQYGSSWYHSHYSVQYADGAVGPMTLHGPTSADFDEAISPPLIITDWGHNTAFDAVTVGLAQPDILLNGLGNVTNYNNSIANTTEILPPYQITFEGPVKGRADKKYLIRVINTSFDTTFVFSIDNHMLQVVTADFVPILPYKNQSILIGIGQRYNVIVEANPLLTPDTGPLPKDGNYWIRTQVADKCFQQKTPSPGHEKTGILRYNASSTAYPTTRQWKYIPTDCRDEDYEKLSPVYPWCVGKPPINAQGGDENGEKFDVWIDPNGPSSKNFPLAFWSLGGDEFTPLRVDYTNITFFNLDNKGGWDPLWNIVPENYTNSTWVYLAFKGKLRPDGTNNQGAHPIHLHGHDFAILEQAYNKTFDPKKLNLKFDNPPRRDVVLLPRNGYVVIAFKADNPGAWLVHCHIAFHISEGLGMQIMEAQDEAEKIWPKGNSKALTEAGRVCKNWETWYNNTDNWAVPPKSRQCKTPEHPEWCFQDDSGV